MSKTELVRLIDGQNSRLKKQDSKLQKQNSELQKQKLEIKEQKYLIAQLRRMLFGSKRERFEQDDSTQGVIPFEDYATREQNRTKLLLRKLLLMKERNPKDIRAETSFLKISR